jgi:monomeric sarcosine oxidase
VLIVGGGTMGLAAAVDLARRGASVTVLERHDIGHDLGSHSGFTRVIRHAYHEGSAYVPLVQEADAAWLALEKTAGDRLLVRTGLVEFGPLGDAAFHDAIAAVVDHDIEHEMMDGAEARKRWPLDVPDGWQACYTPSGGFLRVGPCFAAMRGAAAAAGAVFRTGIGVASVDVAKRPTVVLDDGSKLDADKLVVAAGVGLPDVLPSVVPALACLRRVLVWTTPAPQHVGRLAAMPVWCAFTPEGFFYGFPHGNEGITGLKLAVHQSDAIADLDEPVDPATVDRTLRPEDVGPLQDFIDLYFSAAQGEVAGHRVCLYAATPSWDFVVDRHPDNADVVIAGGFSGHGFKFAPIIGRLVAGLALDGAAPLPTFALARHRE